MNRSMLVGTVAGVALAVTGAVVAGYALRDDAPAAEERVALAADDTTTSAAAPTEECWDETVTHEKEAKDEKRIAGTAIGAVVGGVIGNNVGDSDLATAAGAAAGGYAGSKAQKEFQEGQTYTTTERRCRPVNQ